MIDRVDRVDRLDTAFPVAAFPADLRPPAPSTARDYCGLTRGAIAPVDLWTSR